MYARITQGTSPFVITVPHDGTIRIKGAPIRRQVEHWIAQYGSDQRDSGTSEWAESCATRLRELGCAPTLIIFDLHRGHVDVNRDPDKEPYAISELEGCYREFHVLLHRIIEEKLQKFGRCLLLDVHSFLKSPGQELDFVLGTDEDRTCPRPLSGEIQKLLRCSQHGRYTTEFSPDAERGITKRYKGGYVVRHAADRFSAQIQEGCFGAIQLEICRRPLFLATPQRIGFQIANALSTIFKTHLVL